MDERHGKGGTEWKKKEVGDKKKKKFFSELFLFLDKTLSRNPKARRANKTISIYLL
jgi:hypothetical protein